VICVTMQRGVFKQLEVYHPRPEKILDLLNQMRTVDVILVRDCPIRLPSCSAILSEEATQDATIDLSQSEAELLRRMDATSCRYRIRRAEKLGQRLRLRTNDTTAREDFLLLYHRFIDQKYYLGNQNGFRPRPLTWARMQKFEGLYDVSVAYIDDKPLAAHIHLRDENERRVTELMAPNVRLDQGADKILVGLASYYLKWQLICHYKKQDFMTYSLGRMDPNNVVASIASFKRSFGAEAVALYDYLLAGPLARGAFRLRNSARRMLQKAGIVQRVWNI
jgi:hypothetical protein